MKKNSSPAVAQTAIKALENLKVQSLKVFDTRGLSNLFDIVIICSGTSNRHTRSLANQVYVDLKQTGVWPLTVEGEGSGEWVLVDAGDTVIHIMLPVIRQYYNLEALWGDKEIPYKAGH